MTKTEEINGSKFGKSRLMLSASMGAIVSAALLMIPNMSFAQTATPAASTEQSGEVVIVTGVRDSIRRSINLKRRNESIIEAVTAVDIGKLPDVSIAESLARLPGVAAQRVNGRSQSLSIRGMGPQFSATLLNGQEMVSTGDDRSFEYDQFPSELVSQALVYKTPDAALGSQGLAGTVDIRTMRPLDLNGRTVSLNARYESNSFDEVVPGMDSTGNRLSAFYANQFMDGTFGVAIGVAHLDSPTEKKYFNPWDYGKAGDLGVSGPGVSANDLIYDGFETGVQAWTTERNGALAVFEYKPNDNFHSTANLFYSQFDQNMSGMELFGIIADWGMTATPVVTQNNGAGGFTVHDANLGMASRQNERKDEIGAINWNNSFKLGGWEMTADLGFSRAQRDEAIYEMYVTPKSIVDITTTFEAGFDGFGKVTSPFNFGIVNNWEFGEFWNVPGWGGDNSIGVADHINADDEMTTIRLAGHHELNYGIFETVDLGIIASNRTKELTYYRDNIAITNPTTCRVSLCAPIPTGILGAPASLGFTGIPSVLNFKVTDAMRSGLFSVVHNYPSPLDTSLNLKIEEEITTGYGKLGLGSIFGLPTRGNVGIQVIHANQTSDGLQATGGGTFPLRQSAEYTDVLPSLNLIYDINDSTMIRFGAAKVVARPQMLLMRANISASVIQTGANAGKWAGSGGNPKLEPWRANAYDISLEKYVSKGTYFSIAAFYKDITSAIFINDIPYDFTGFRVYQGSIQPTSNIGTMSAPANAQSGFIRGWEFSGAFEFGNLSPALEGFGVLASYSDTESTIPGATVLGQKTTDSLEGLSGQVWNAQVYYERHGYQFRIAQRHRSSFNARRHDAFAVRMNAIMAETITDVQAGYTIQSGPLKDLAFLFQINNLDNTPYVVTQPYLGTVAAGQYHEFGRQYLFGVSYKF